MSSLQPRRNPIDEPVELGRLLASTIGSVVQAQEQLDLHAERRRRAYEAASEGSLALPPLCYVFETVDINMELSVTVDRSRGAGGADTRPRLLSRTLNPALVGLYGYRAASGLRVRAVMTPRGYVPIKASPVEDPASRRPKVRRREQGAAGDG